MSLPLIAIDGPAGVGKTTTARAVAQRLGIPYLDTGALYRAVTCLVQRNHLNLHDTRSISRALEQTRLTCLPGLNGLHVWIDDVEVTREIRSQEVTRAVTEVCEIPEVRRYLVSIQRRWASRGFGVVEGRDIGTIVLPDAGLKVFLTAQPAARALRRGRDLGIADDAAAMAKLTDELAERDRRDSERADSPLRQASDAVLLDTSFLSPTEQLNELIRMAAERFNLRLYRMTPNGY